MKILNRKSKNSFLGCWLLLTIGNILDYKKKIFSISVENLQIYLQIMRYMIRIPKKLLKILLENQIWSSINYHLHYIQPYGLVPVKKTNEWVNKNQPVGYPQVCHLVYFNIFIAFTKNKLPYEIYSPNMSNKYHSKFSWIHFISIVAHHAILNHVFSKQSPESTLKINQTKNTSI